MYQLIALYHQPENPATFDKHYDEVHAPLAKAMPGLRRFTISHPVPGPEGPPAYHLVAVLDFDDEAAFGAAMESAQGKAAVADLPNFAGAGVTLLNGPAGLA